MIFHNQLSFHQSGNQNNLRLILLNNKFCKLIYNLKTNNQYKYSLKKFQQII